MKKLITLLLLTACTLACQDAGLQHYWDSGITIDNYALTRDRFVRFAEKLNAASPQKADKAIDALMDKLVGDEVSYYIYSEWFVSAFHSLLSPVRNPELFAKFAGRLNSDGIMSEDDYTPLQELAALDRLNLPGTDCTVPPLYDASGNVVSWTPGEHTVFLVLNLDCATCVAALRALSDEDGKHVALCYGHTAPPSIPGWEFLYSDSLEEVFDIDEAPFWFTVGPDGKVVKAYSPAPVYNSFATPDAL